MNAETAERIVRLRLAMVTLDEGEFQVWFLERITTAVRSGLRIGSQLNEPHTGDLFLDVVLMPPPRFGTHSAKWP